MGKRNVTRLFIGVISVALGVVLVSAVCHAIPQTINYQGYLTDSEGHPLDGTVDMVFALYDVDTGGSSLWSETQTGVEVTEGIFSVNLGAVTPITLSFDNPYWLGVQVESDAEMTPRQPITSVGYAYRAGEADAVKTGGVESYMLAEDAVTADKIDDGAVLTAHLDTGAVTADKLDDDAVTSAKIVDNTVTTDDILDGSGSFLDADTLDGNDAGAFMPAEADNWVDEAGDTMTGPLNVPENGLAAGTDQLVLANGNVGIGESSPEEKLEVQGNIKVASTGNGIIFPDASKQTTAASGTGVPPGYMILGHTPTPPPGYTYVYVLQKDNEWTPRAAMPTGRRSLAAAEAGGKIYAIGGLSSATSCETANEEYDPVADSWATKAAMPTGRYGLAAAAAGGKIYAIGGRSSATDYETANEEYDPVADSWATKAAMPTGRRYLAAAEAGGKIYAIGGTSSATNYETANEEYTTGWTYYLFQKD